ncbi:MAG TPA: WcbI family polysaccharide biosynthesis putative acetyltransferase [Stellaceae bacterium]|jgi:hypothetical protein|nr:WcbI family polysaccharide biosynthesis putative acetyltransferase [Stellaceae bacterium]
MPDDMMPDGMMPDGTMPDDMMTEALRRRLEELKEAEPEDLHWSLLGRLENAAIGKRAGDGSITVGRRERAGCILYGPYLHLPRGWYRLNFCCRSGAPRMTAQPVLGVEIIVLSRFQEQWRDFTAAELADGTGSVEFEVTQEHSLEGGNEGRFEFRFFHLGNAGFSINSVELEGLAPDETPPMAPRRWRMLGRLSKTWLGRRAASGEITVRRAAPAGCLVYGGWPYLRLPRGQYRMVVKAACGPPRFPGRPVLGIQIMAESRWRNRHPLMQLARLPEITGVQQAWREVSAEDLTAGSATVDFVVPTELAIEAGADAPFDIRLHPLGNAALTILSIDVVELDIEDRAEMPEPTWQLLGRMQSGRLLPRRAGMVTVTAAARPGRFLANRRGALRLPYGRYRLRFAGQADPAASPETPLFRAELTAQPPRAAMGSTARPMSILDATTNAAELRGGSAQTEFEVPAATALGVGNWNFMLAATRLGQAGFSLDSIEIARLPDTEPHSTQLLAAPRLRPSGRRKLVIIGNCQSETLRQGFAHAEGLNKLFEAKYHFVQLPKNLHEFAARDIETCDVLLVQDIRLWDEFPLRDRVRPGTDVLKFPLIRFGSPWPFDAWNGPADKEAHDSEAPNLTFPYLDGLLGRLRKEIPDHEARFEAYRALDFSGVVNYRRLHDLEVRRLAALDKKYDFTIGEFILENFKNRRVFHTTVRPNWEVFTLLLQYVANLVGATEPISLTEGIDAALRNPQVPVHPKVARDLGIKWADENTRYLNRGREITWETYTRSYIEHYG